MSIKSLPSVTILNGLLTLRENDTCFEYSENPKKLKKLMQEVEITVEYKGTDIHFTDDKEKRIILEIKVLRGENGMFFTFGMSIHDTELFALSAKSAAQKLPFAEIYKKRYEIRDNLLYSILSCIASDYYCPETFEDFCTEFGYDTDSRRAEKTFHACLEQSRKLKTVFTPEEIEYLPR